MGKVGFQHGQVCSASEFAHLKLRDGMLKTHTHRKSIGRMPMLPFQEHASNFQSGKLSVFSGRCEAKQYRTRSEFRKVLERLLSLPFVVDVRKTSPTEDRGIKWSQLREVNSLPV